jgi:uncharacterized protein
MTFIAAGFVLGLAASVHCVVMCGPLMMAVLSRRNRRAAVLYHGSRLFTYGALGAATGAAGHLAGLAGAGRVLSVVAGLALIWIAVRRAGWLKADGRHRPPVGLAVGLAVGLTRIIVRATQAIRARFDEASPLRIASAGILNGLLPCGPVYAALTAAAALGDSRQSAAFMLAFGAGTLPALAATGTIAALTLRFGGSRWRFAAPAALALIGVLLTMRGLTPSHAHHPQHHHPATAPGHPPAEHHAHTHSYGRGAYGKRVASAFVPAANGTPLRSE